MAVATALISSLFNVSLSQDVPFPQLQQLQCLHHGSLLCAPFLSPLLRRWQFVAHVLWLRCKTRVSAELAGALLTLFVAWSIAQHVQRARSKQSVMIHHD